MCPAYTSVKGAKSGTLAKGWRIYSDGRGNKDGQYVWVGLGVCLHTAWELGLDSVLPRIALLLLPPNQGSFETNTRPNRDTTNLPRRGQENPSEDIEHTNGFSPKHGTENLMLPHATEGMKLGLVDLDNGRCFASQHRLLPIAARRQQTNFKSPIINENDFEILKEASFFPIFVYCQFVISKSSWLAMVIDRGCL